MQPESFPTDDSLGRSVQPASAPLPAKEGAFGEENAPYEAVFGDVSKIIDAARDSAARSVNAANKQDTKSQSAFNANTDWLLPESL